ncbi:MAG: hypothetical protein LIO70_06880 [Clostridiales bacterium]|nr:hypothetical protein [Clostridiales bacterium]
MILSTQIHLGQRVTVHVSVWMEGTLTGRVIYLHPARRYFTVRFDCGVQESFPMADPARLARRAIARPVPGKPKAPPDDATARVQQALAEAGVKATDVSRALGYNKAWLAIRMQRGVPAGMVDGLLQTIGRVAEEKKNRP